jgi:hypothetical protein
MSTNAETFLVIPEDAELFRSIKAAMIERDLAERSTGKKHRVVRVKKYLNGAQRFALMLGLMKAIAHDGYTPGNEKRLHDLLHYIEEGKRRSRVGERPSLTARVDRYVPEFEPRAVD